MALSRRTGQKFQASIWPGFVDAMTALLLVLMFVLTIFMIVQFVLRETITGQDKELDQLTSQVMELADALGLEENRARELSENLSQAEAQGRQQQALIASLRGQNTSQEAALTAARNRITGFEAQVASLLRERNAALANSDALVARLDDLQRRQDRLFSESEAARLALAQAREETDAAAEAARLAAAQREALEAMTAELQERANVAEAELSDAETARLAESIAAEALRERLQNADTELTAMTLALEAERQEAEDTLTLLAAARLAQEAAAGALSDAERDAILLAQAQEELRGAQAASAESQRAFELLNRQVAELRGQLGALQNLLDEAAARDSAANVQLEALGSQLNSALAQVASEERRRRELEEAERRRLEGENADLAQYRSEFFGKLRDVLGNQEGVRIVGDRFVFSSEVLFRSGSVDLLTAGQGEVAKIAAILSEVAGDIPPEIDWVIRVDGHTDDVPQSSGGRYRDNWELSQGRALSVVRYMIEDLGIPAQRLIAAGFGEHHPINPENSSEARAQNRRIELKFTEK
ncbi:peptidoglycan -binding protein [Halocynthiibacter namhaensis]|uniref:peptidoglycan -binding protein n=1 Tax=Halocynthiibacter namhaensis TaxID=1290553 RepID=UPI0005793051|nr:peptidoglycan -binding protein [Halocynthiibacter namhaensis]